MANWLFHGRLVMWHSKGSGKHGEKSNLVILFSSQPTFDLAIRLIFNLFPIHLMTVMV